jgi:hypothetical protein
MKSLFYLIIAIFATQISPAEDWQLFVEGRTSYYKQQYDTTALVETFIWDSTRSEDGVDYMYFNRKIGLSPACYDSVQSGLEFFWMNPASVNKFDSLVRSEGQYNFRVTVGDQEVNFPFNPGIYIEESWTWNEIIFECTDIYQGEVLGEKDSIKVIEVTGGKFTGIEFLVSKNNGFIKFLPFQEFISPENGEFPPRFELIGYEQGDIKKGYVQPGMQDYYHLQPGDKLCWSHTNWWPMPTGYSYYDSVMKADYSDEKITYNMKRVTIREGKIEKTNYQKKIITGNEGNMFNNPTSTIGFTEENFHLNEGWYEVFYKQPLHIKIENGDTITYSTYSFPGLLINPETCEIGEVMDADLELTFNTKYGLIYGVTYSWGQENWELIGSIIGGREEGRIVSSVKENSLNENNLRIFPNPASNSITLDLPESEIKSVKIYNFSGKFLGSFDLTNEIDVQELAPGAYMIQSELVNGSFAWGTFIKD